MTSARSSSDGGDVVSKVVLSGVIAAIVGGLAAYADTGIVFLVIAVTGSIVAFWIIDAVLDRATEVGATGPVRTGPLPATSTEPLAPPRGVEPPQIAEPDPAPGTEASDKQTARLDPSLFDPGSIEIRSDGTGAGRVFSIRVAKHGNAIGECEDAVMVDPRRGVLAIADGASSSFGAGVWANTLTTAFVRSPPKPLSVASFSSWLDATRSALPGSESGGSDEQPNGWWSEQGAREGAFSTIVGAAVMADGQTRVATVMCLGDSCAFVLTGERGARVVRRSLPYEDAEQFGSHPALLGSMPDRVHDEPTWTTVPTAPGDLLVLASDAVSEWLLGDPKRFQLLDDDSLEAIAQRFVSERTDGRMVNDDLTIAVMELTS